VAPYVQHFLGLLSRQPQKKWRRRGENSIEGKQGRTCRRREKRKKIQNLKTHFLKIHSQIHISKNHSFYLK
jgi:hypothetical protein